MNRSFENIFDKYNIPYKLPRKRKKQTKATAKSLVFHNTNKRQQLFTNKNRSLNTVEVGYDLETTCDDNLNTTTQFYVNTSTKGKYCRPTRYKTLDLVPSEYVKNRTAATLSVHSFNTSSEGELESKENVSLLANKEVKIVEKFLVNKTFTGDLDFKRNSLSSTLNVGRRKNNNKNYTQTRYKQLDLSVIPKSSLNINNTLNNNLNDDKFNETFKSLPCSSSELSQTIDPFTPTQDTANDTNTELDLLIDLIQQENKQIEMRPNFKKNNLLTKTQKPLKGGYEEMFERALKRETVSGSFLKHDRKIGLRYGKQLSVVRMETAYDITIAIVKGKDLDDEFGIIIAEHMISQLKEDSIIEAFFDENTQPYKMKVENNELLDVYFEPYKLLVV